MRATRSHGLAALISGSLLALAGCTGVEPAVFGAGLNVAKAGVSFVDGEDLRSFELVRYDDVIAACDKAAEVLSLELRYTRHPEDGWQIRNYSLRGRAVMFIEIWQETDTITMLRTEARTPRQRGVASLFAKQVFTELDRADAYLETWARNGGAARDIRE